MTPPTGPHTRAWLAAAAISAVVVAGVATAWLVVPKVATSPRGASRGAAATRDASNPTTPAPKAPSHPRSDREHIVAAAYGLLGAPYRWGAKGPEAYDCSGLTKAAYHAAGVALPDGSFNQAQHERPLKAARSLTAGDLVFYRWAGKKTVSHVTLYVGAGWVIGAGSPGQPRSVALYPLAADLVGDGRVITYRHVRLPDEH